MLPNGLTTINVIFSYNPSEFLISSCCLGTFNNVHFSTIAIQSIILLPFPLDMIVFVVNGGTLSHCPNVLRSYRGCILLMLMLTQHSLLLLFTIKASAFKAHCFTRLLYLCTKWYLNCLILLILFNQQYMSDNITGIKI